MRLRPEEMLRAGRHLSACGACRVRLRDEVANGAQILQRLHLDEDQVLEAANYEEVFDRLSERSVEGIERTEREKSAAPFLLQKLADCPIAEQGSLLRCDPKFHTAPFVESLLKSAQSSWSDDQAGSERLSRLALEVTDHLDPALYGSGLINDLRARAWGFVANARRIYSDLRGADEAFREAECLLVEGSGDPLESARLLDLKASLRRAQRRFGEALGLLEEVVGICRKVHEIHLEGRALIGQALIHDYAEEPEKAVPLLFDALTKIDLAQEPRLLWTILQTLTLSFIGLGEYLRAAALLPETQRVAAEVGTADDLTHTLWVEGLLDLGLQRYAAAEVKLKAVRDRYAELGIGYNTALASLDLAKVYLSQGRTAETKRLVAEIHPIFVSRDVQREAIAALLVLQQAIAQERASARRPR